ncbi:MAG TPA: DUF4159 domain-containing protein [Phycisphaerae bacterium]|nr:DUF4159 domain-containing protein [Phycisphaerae bacterium]
MHVPLDNLEEWKYRVRRELKKTLDRRRFMRRGLAALAGGTMIGTLMRIFGGGGGRVFAASGAVDTSHAVKTGTFFFPRLKFDVLNGRCVWNVYPHADVILRQSLAKMTNVNVSSEPVVVSLADFNTMRHYPFVFATDERHFRFPKNEEANLREFLLRGGFIYGDDCVLGRTEILFFEDFRKMMNRIYPDNPMRRVPDDHEIYHCHFDLPNGLPFLQGKNVGSWATFDKESDRILTFLTPTDMHCGWTCQYFSPKLNEQAIQMGVNIILFYLTH